MKKTVALLLFLFAAFAAAGCTGDKYTASDYFPFTENTYCEYEGDGHVLANIQTYSGYVRGGRMQRRNTVVEDYPAQMEIFEYKNGTVTVIRADVSAYYPEDATYLPATMDIPILRDPIKLNSEWSSRDGLIFKITAVNKKITVPYGTFNVIEVTSETPSYNYIEKNYYAPGIGLVETRYSTDDGPWIISRLKSVTEDTPIEIPTLVFYPDEDGVGAYSFETSITIRTNSDVFKEVETLLKSRSPDGAFGPLLPVGSVNAVTVMRADNTGESYAIIDLGPEVYGINDSEDSEGGWLYALGCTVGTVYGVGYVSVYVNGAPFNGEYVQLDPGEMILVAGLEEAYEE